MSTQQELHAKAVDALRTVVVQEGRVAAAEHGRRLRIDGRTRRSWGMTIHNLERPLNRMYNEAIDAMRAAGISFDPIELGHSPEAMLHRVEEMVQASV